MLKKFCLTMCLVACLAWAQDDEDDEDYTPARSKSAAVVDEDDDDAPAARSAATEDEDEEEEATGLSRAQREERISRKKFEEEQRQDEYANSLRRRDWLKDRLIFEIGMGSRMPFMGETGMGMGFGAGVEYITAIHLGAFASFGLLPKGTDNAFSEISLEGGTGWKAGINYYLFPKDPLHLGISVSYGTVYFDHGVEPNADNVRPLISVEGVQADILVTYLTNEWYFLQFSFGFYYAPKLAKWDENNPSLRPKSREDDTLISAVENPKGMKKFEKVFGITIGYAFPEFFPDDTEKRRRQREKERARSNR